MKINIQIKNFGKIKDEHLKIRPFTVCAGKNSSGKSFITKALYSFFSTINEDHITVQANVIKIKLKNYFHRLQNDVDSPSNTLNELLNKFSLTLDDLSDNIEEAYGSVTYVDQISNSFLIEGLVSDLDNILEQIKLEVGGKKKYLNLSEHFSFISNALKNLSKIAEKPDEKLGQLISERFRDSLLDNFQVPTLKDLRNKSSDGDEVYFDFDTLGKIRIEDDYVSFNLNADSIDEFQKLYNVVYIESPIYWKLISALERLRRPSPFDKVLHRKTKQLLGVPKHFYDLVDLLKEKRKISDSELSNSAVNSELVDMINSAIDGEIKFADSGSLYFSDGKCGSNINISTTATGITNLGIISLLLKKNVISKGSFVFVDEPEVNLHPDWQKVMIDTLYEMSKNGINVVIATHSIDMIKRIENIMSAFDGDIEEHFGINHLCNEKSDFNSDSLQKMSVIKEDLGQSFYDMFLESEW